MGDYTHGEIQALVGPILRFPAENIQHYVIVAQSKEGIVRSIGCNHDTHLMITILSEYAERGQVNGSSLNDSNHPFKWEETGQHDSQDN